jgi:hypothetical protein
MEQFDHQVNGTAACTQLSENQEKRMGDPTITGFERQ